MQVYAGPYLPEPGAGLQVASVGGTEWKSPEINTDSSGHSGGINTGDVGGLNI